MGAFDYGSPLGDFFSFLAGRGGAAPGFDPAGAAPTVDQFRDDWNASQQAQNLPTDDAAYYRWLSVNGTQGQPQAPANPAAQAPGYGLGNFLFGSPAQAATESNPFPGAPRVPPPVPYRSASAADAPSLNNRQTSDDPEAQTVPLSAFPFLGGLFGASASPTAPQPQAASPVLPPQSAAPQQPPMQEAMDFGGGSDVTAPVNPLVVGDSIAGHMITFGGAPGSTDRKTVGQYKPGLTAVNGYTPSQILDTVIPGIPDEQVRGRNVVLSTGASNDPTQLSVIPQQIQALKDRGATGVTLMGVGNAPQLQGVNDALAKTATDTGSTFAGPLRSVGKDGIHSTDPRGDFAALTDPASQPTANPGAQLSPPMQEAMDFGGGSDDTSTSPQPTQANAPIGAGLGKHAPAAISALKEQGLSTAAQQGILANGMAEGGFDSPWVKSSAPGENSFGHWQFNAKGELPNYLANEGKDNPQDPANQARFVARRMEELVPGFKNIDDPELATRLVQTKFERPANLTSRSGQLKTVQANWTGSPSGATGQADQVVSSPEATGIRQGTPQGIIKVADNGTSSYSGQGLPGIGANGLLGVGSNASSWLQRLPPDAKPEQVLEDFLNKSGLPEAAKMKLLIGLQKSMPPQSNAAATLANMAAGFLGGNGPAASLSGGFRAMGEGLGQNTKTANQFQEGNLKSLEGALPDANPLDAQKIQFAKLLATAGVPLGDALVQVGVVSPDRGKAINAQAQQTQQQQQAASDNEIVPSEFNRLTSLGVPPQLAAPAAVKKPTPEALQAANDAVNQNKPMAPGVQKAVDESLKDISSTQFAQAQLRSVMDDVKSGRLDLSPLNQLKLKAEAAVGYSSDEVVAFQRYKALQAMLASDELRKNKGVQTDQDAVRTMELIAGGGITSNDQFLTHSGMLDNRLSNSVNAAEVSVNTHYKNSNKGAFDWDTFYHRQPGEKADQAAIKQLGNNPYGQTPVPQSAAPQVGGGTGIGVSPERMQELNKKHPGIIRQ